MSRLSDTIFRRKFKLFIMVAISLCAGSMWWFTLMLPSPFSTDGVLPRSTTCLAAAIMIQGLTQGMLIPLLYEFCAELTYPVNEGTSAGMLTFIWNLATLLVLATSSKISTDTPSSMYASALVLCAVLVSVTKETYVRADAESEYNHQKKLDQGDKDGLMESS
eukprot:TRINITY_DN7591_c0_g1_i1.p2 TRINITY_DN7591_c0_g1~~TRINITY_DN7591_c0_g1_i1.p2  ORF type:complete len:163 (+),score=39.21 TRINITY_DN7591_c0_g1_i1:213-701(+)